MTSERASMIVAIGMCIQLLLADVSQAEIKTIASASKVFLNRRLGFSFENETFAYADCDKSDDVMKKCNVSLSVKSLEPTYKCNVTLHAESDIWRFHPKIRTYMLGTDKVILVWGLNRKLYERTEDDCDETPIHRRIPMKIKYTIVQPGNNCRELGQANIDVHSTSSFLAWYNYNVVPYVNTFDIVFFSIALCDDKYCRITFNENGNNLTSVQPWFPKSNWFHSRTPIVPLTPRNPAEGFLVNVGSGPFLLNSDGTNTTIPSQKPDFYIFASAVSDDAVTTCYRYHYNEIKNITCLQYNRSTGVIASDVALNLTYSIGSVYKAEQASAVENLSNGQGFLLALSSDDEKLYHVYKFDANSRLMGELQIKMTDCNVWRKYRASGFYVGEHNQYCLNIVCATGPQYDAYESDSILYIQTTCFDESDFKK